MPVDRFYSHDYSYSCKTYNTENRNYIVLIDTISGIAQLRDDTINLLFLFPLVSLSPRLPVSPNHPMFVQRPISYSLPLNNYCLKRIRGFGN